MIWFNDESFQVAKISSYSKARMLAALQELQVQIQELKYKLYFDDSRSDQEVIEDRKILFRKGSQVAWLEKLISIRNAEEKTKSIRLSDQKEKKERRDKFYYEFINICKRTLPHDQFKQLINEAEKLSGRPRQDQS